MTPLWDWLALPQRHISQDSHNLQHEVDCQIDEFQVRHFYSVSLGCNCNRYVESGLYCSRKAVRNHSVTDSGDRHLREVERSPRRRSKEIKLAFARDTVWASWRARWHCLSVIMWVCVQDMTHSFRRLSEGHPRLTPGKCQLLTW